MTEQKFKNTIDGLLNDFINGASDEKEFRDGILDVLIELSTDIQNKYDKALELLQTNRAETLVRQGAVQPVQTAGKWIDVKSKLPDNAKHVLCLTDTGLRSIGYLYNGKWERGETIQSFAECGYKVTHWMPLPDRIN